MVVDAKREDGKVEVIGLRPLTLSVPYFAPGSSTLQGITMYVIDGICRHYIHDKSLVLPLPHHQAMETEIHDERKPCPVSMYFFGQDCGYDSPTLLPRPDAAKMPLPVSNKVNAANGVTVRTTVSLVPWSLNMTEDALGLAESLGGKAALAYTFGELNEAIENARSAWSESSLASDPMYSIRMKQLCNIYDTKTLEFWSRSRSLDRYRNVARDVAVGITKGTVPTNSNNWMSEAMTISGYPTGIRLFWESYDYVHDRANFQGVFGYDKMIRAAEELKSKMEQERRMLPQVEQQIQTLSRILDSMQFLSADLKEYVRKLRMVPMASLSAPESVQCQVSSPELHRHYSVMNKGTSSVINTDYTATLPTHRADCSSFLTNTYEYAASAFHFDSTRKRFSDLGQRLLNTAKILSDSTFNARTWRSFRRYCDMISSFDRPFDAFETSVVQKSILTLGGAREDEYQGAKKIILRIIDYMKQWYSTHKEYDNDDLEKTIPNKAENMFPAYDLWDKTGLAERSIVELFVYLSAGLEKPDTPLQDVIDDGDIPEYLSRYFSVDEDRLEEHFKAVLGSKRLLEFNVNNTYWRLPAARVIEVRKDLVEPDPVESKSGNRGSTLLQVVIEEDDEVKKAPNKTTATASLQKESYEACDLIIKAGANVVQNSRTHIANTTSGHDVLSKLADKCSHIARTIKTISESSVASVDVQSTNLPFIQATDICTVLKDYSTSRGYSPMWSTNSRELVSSVLRNLRENHGMYLSEEYETINKARLCYDPLNREWVVLISNETYNEDEPCAVIKTIAVGISFKSGSATVSSVRVCTDKNER
jgi:hypothetical protein